MQTRSKVAGLWPRILELRKSFKIALAVLATVVLCLLIYPFQLTVVPEWRLRVIDDDGDPVAGINVTEHWQHYLIEATGHEEVQTTGADGFVHFRARTIRAGLMHRFVAHLTKLPRSGVDGRTDIYSAVVAWGSKQHSTAVLVRPEGTSPPATIIVRRLG